ncbi:hypothetical protein JR316_0011274 [Psilocybe cubensis]|uniref:Uncharacterized protein n=2 Tax=Psilocybe cubensis TaxID=181762 RepID=A0ACB8GL12_PSICU|nr:hypothetical protein JR316_0011274 [Psilocybe cubensis]KAH9475715.1 hypothetical protein JR316_0011274 [Psilocybe cubensis]
MLAERNLKDVSSGEEETALFCNEQTMKILQAKLSEMNQILKLPEKERFERIRDYVTKRKRVIKEREDAQQQRILEEKKRADEAEKKAKQRILEEKKKAEQRILEEKKRADEAEKKAEQRILEAKKRSDEVIAEFNKGIAPFVRALQLTSLRKLQDNVHKKLSNQIGASWEDIREMSEEDLRSKAPNVDASRAMALIKAVKDYRDLRRGYISDAYTAKLEEIWTALNHLYQPREPDLQAYHSDNHLLEACYNLLKAQQ